MKYIAKILLVIGLLLPLTGCQSLNATDQKAFEYISKAALAFKNPQSVRIADGAYVPIEGDGKIFAELSAENSFGARGVSLYIIWPDGDIYDLNTSSSSSTYREETEVWRNLYYVLTLGYVSDYTTVKDIDKINSKLEKTLKNKY